MKIRRSEGANAAPANFDGPLICAKLGLPPLVYCAGSLEVIPLGPRIDD